MLIILIYKLFRIAFCINFLISTIVFNFWKLSLCCFNYYLTRIEIIIFKQIKFRKIDHESYFYCK
ncbi:unnamed protein product [Paramecium pentaurelia]|uniref:Uncharacterized protein n=1 Tax=Paramecium pentaurelia TaxID=43138 RepID=A0A8S1U8W6_9CILI|nr:unnamed protein product [Paramecium pentaurelia]